jgi:hypothetical protein
MSLTSHGNAANKASMAPFAAQKEPADKYSNKRNDPPALSLDERGMILECSKSFEMLFGFMFRCCFPSSWEWNWFRQDN